MRMTTLRLALPSLLLGVTVACAQDSQLLERTVTRVDPAGGVARSTDGLATLRVPRGALTVATDITMLTRRDVRDPQLRSLVYELGPAGLVLDAPITLTIAVADARSPAAVVRLVGRGLTPVEGSTWAEGDREARAELRLLTSYAAASTASTAADGAVDGGPDSGPDSGLGAMGTPCRVTSECEAGLYCQYWEPGCDQIGSCLPHPPLDAGFSCRGVCDCTGRWRGNTYTDFPFQYRSFGLGDPQTCTPPAGFDAGPDADAGPPMCSDDAGF